MLYAIGLFTVYVIFILIRYNGIETISESYYRLNNNGYIFSLWLGMVAMMVMYHNLDKIAIILACSGLIYVAIAAMYKEEIGGRVHVTGALSAVIFGLIWLATNGYFPLAVIHLFLSALFTFTTKRSILWIEIMSFYLITIPLIWG